MAEDQETENGGWNQGPGNKPQRLALLYTSISQFPSVKDSTAFQNTTTRWGLGIQNVNPGPGEMVGG